MLGKFFTERVLRCWNKVPREVVDALSSGVLKASLNGALGPILVLDLAVDNPACGKGLGLGEL